MGGTFCVFKELSTRNLVLDNQYNASFFEMVLKVEFNGIVENWLCLKHSRIQNSGLGVFAQREFCEKEFVTAYLGIVELNPLETE